jgi:hypothetical protein
MPPSVQARNALCLTHDAGTQHKKVPRHADHSGAHAPCRKAPRDRPANKRRARHHAARCARATPRREAHEDKTTPAPKATRTSTCLASAAGHERCGAGVLTSTTARRGQKRHRNARGRRAFVFAASASPLRRSKHLHWRHEHRTLRSQRRPEA